MTKRRRAQKASFRTFLSSSTTSSSTLLGLAILFILIAFAAVVLGISILLLPLVLIPMWMIGKEWSRRNKVIISVLTIVIWMALLPFALSFLGDILDSQEKRDAVNSQSTILPTTTHWLTDSPSPVPTPTPVALPTLMKGMSGEHVTILQNQLISLHYLQGDADGLFGPQTEQAVKNFQIRNGLDANGVVDMDTAFWLFSGKALAFDPLQEMILSIDKNTTRADVEAMIEMYSLPYTLQQFNSDWGQVMVYKIAYVEGATRHKHGITDNHVVIKFSKKTGKIVYASYFNVDAFHADYHKNYEIRIYFEEGRGGLLGCYGFNASFDGYDMSNREVPFNSVEEALHDVLENASQYIPDINQ